MEKQIKTIKDQASTQIEVFQNQEAIKTNKKYACSDKDGFSILDKTTDAKISLADAKNNQVKFKSNLSEKKGNKKHRSKDQKDALYNIEMLYKARNSVAEFLLQWYPKQNLKQLK